MKIKKEFNLIVKIFCANFLDDQLSCFVDTKSVGFENNVLKKKRLRFQV